MKIRVGTRGSRLARVQSRDVARMLEQRGHEVELVLIKTLGDQQQTMPFEQVGPAGVFVVEIERALLENRIDLAVHSYKDLPSIKPEGLIVAAVPERLDPADVLLVREESSDASKALPVKTGGVVGTASKRRESWLAALRPDLTTRLLRGNLPTRVAKLVEREFDAILLAGAGLKRLARGAERQGEEPLPLAGIRVERLDPEQFVPAPSQGALAVQVRQADEKLLEIAGQLDDAASHRAVSAERALLELVEGGCSLPFGAWCQADEESPTGALRMVAMLGVDGVAGGVVKVDGRHEDPLELAAALYEQLKEHR